MTSNRVMIPVWKRIVLPVIAVAVLLAGCAQRLAQEVAPEAYWSSEIGADGARTGETLVADIEIQEQLIIRNADLAIVVGDAEAAIDAIDRLAVRADGWVVSSNVWESEGIKRGSITVRVTAGQLDTFLEEVHRLANRVTQQSISGENVTEEYVDLGARLRNLEATAARVRSFLDDAKDVEDALAVNAELSRLEQEIERIRGRMQYLEQSARFSQVSIRVTPDALAGPLTIGRWQPEGTARTAIEALVKTLQWLADVLIFVVLYLVPMALVIGLPLYFVIRFLVRRQKRQTKAERAAE